MMVTAINMLPMRITVAHSLDDCSGSIDMTYRVADGLRFEVACSRTQCEPRIISVEQPGAGPETAND